MHPSPRISVLIPVRDAESTLDICLRSIERQSEANFECLIVDDGSQDGSVDRAEALATRDPRFRVIRGERRGLVETLNRGVSECRASLIARMDADDWMRRNRLSTQADLLDRSPDLEAVGSPVRLFPRASLTDGRRRYETWLNGMLGPDQIWRERFVECPVAHPSWMIRKTALEATPYLDRGWPEDYDLMLRLLQNGPVVGTVPQRLLAWRDHPDRLSRTHPAYHLDRFTDCRCWALSRHFLGTRSHYILWGHGRTGRALRKALAGHGHQVERIVEVHPRRIGNTIGGAPVISADELNSHRDLPIVVSVAGAKPRAEIRAALESMQFIEGRDFVFAA